MRNIFIIWPAYLLAIPMVSCTNLPAQDRPLTPVPAVQETADDEYGYEFAGVLELTGRIRVIRDVETYKVTAIILDGDNGHEYNVLLDGEGKNLAKVLKSRIVRVTGEMKEKHGKAFLAVTRALVIGTAAKPQLAAVHKPEPKPATTGEFKPVVMTEPKPPAKPEPILARRPEVVANRALSEQVHGAAVALKPEFVSNMPVAAPSVREIKPDDKVETKTNLVDSSSSTNMAPAAMP